MKMHYAGELRIERGESVKQILGGYAACCSGDLARKIRAQGNHSWLPERVTCQPCQRLLTLSASGELRG